MALVPWRAPLFQQNASCCHPGQHLRMVVWRALEANVSSKRYHVVKAAATAPEATTAVAMSVETAAFKEWYTQRARDMPADLTPLKGPKG